jgi:hypothetical protein
MDGHLTSQTSAAGTFEFGYKDGQVVSVKVSNGQGIDGGQWLRQQNGQFVSPDGTKTATGAVDANGVFKLTLNPSPS